MLRELVSDYLGTIVSTLVIMSTVGGYASTLASDDDVDALKELHQKDMMTIQTQLIESTFNNYSDKIQELELKQNKSDYEKSLLKYYTDKRKGVELKIEMMNDQKHN